MYYKLTTASYKLTAKLTAEFSDKQTQKLKMTTTTKQNHNNKQNKPQDDNTNCFQ